MAYLWGQLISMDGNTVSCCENEGVKDQNGNDLRLCSAIDQERVQDDPTEENVDAVKVTQFSVEVNLLNIDLAVQEERLIRAVAVAE